MNTVSRGSRRGTGLEHGAYTERHKHKRKRRTERKPKAEAVRRSEERGRWIKGKVKGRAGKRLSSSEVRAAEGDENDRGVADADSDVAVLESAVLNPTVGDDGLLVGRVGGGRSGEFEQEGGVGVGGRGGG